MDFAQTFFTNKNEDNATEGSNSIPNSISSRQKSSSRWSASRSPSIQPHSPIPIEELEQVFKKFDVNGDGRISSSELGSILRSLGQNVTEEDAQTLIAEVDTDGDGHIDLNEFVSLHTNDVDSYEVLQNIREAFSIYDADGNGSITPEELQMVMKNLGDDCSIGECRNMIRGVDCDGDGSIDFEEFKFMMMMGARLDKRAS